MKRLLLGPRASIGYWKRNRIDTTQECGRVSPDGFKPDARIAVSYELEKYGIDCNDIDIWIDDLSSRRPSKSVSCKMLKNDVPPGSFRKVTDSLYVMSPEFCIAESARHADIVDVVLMGMEMCGSFHLRLSPDGEKTEAPPLSSAKRISSFLNSADVQKYVGRQSVGNAVLASKHILDGSASPAETALSMLFGMPIRYGGEALANPIMNGRVGIEKSVAEKAGIDALHCDLLWPEFKVAVEYESDKYHSGFIANRNDSRRNNLLVFSGIMLIRITKPMVEDDLLLQEIAQKLRRRMKTKMRKCMSLDEIGEARRALRNKVCPYMGLKYW